MPIDRFYIDNILELHSTVSLAEDEHHHLARVMRCAEGAVVELVNGKGVLAKGKIVCVEKQRTIVDITQRQFSPPPFPLFSLVIPFMRPSKLDWIVEKGTELGVHAFLFYKPQHEEKESFSPQQMHRLQAITLAAIKQSGCLYLPAIQEIGRLTNLLPLLSEPKTYLLFGDFTQEKHSDFASLHTASSVLFATGPQQGFSSSERAFLAQHGTPIRLNAHVLRAETAPVAAASLFGFLF